MVDILEPMAGFFQKKGGYFGKATIRAFKKMSSFINLCLIGFFTFVKRIIMIGMLKL